MVKIGTKFSEPYTIGDFGRPQGSVIGPLLFVISQNDFPDSNEEGNSVMFVDDDTEEVAGHSIEEAQRCYISSNCNVDDKETWRRKNPISSKEFQSTNSNPEHCQPIIGLYH